MSATQQIEAIVRFLHPNTSNKLNIGTYRSSSVLKYVQKLDYIYKIVRVTGRLNAET